MIIREVEINNFRIYKGKNSIDLSGNSDKNISIISGKNGFGKTTFLMSLVWCLYGRQMSKVDELYKKEIDEKGGYGKYIGNSLNLLAKEEGETKFSVSIKFEGLKADEFECEEVEVKREFDVVTGTEDKVEIYIDGHPNDLFADLARESQSGEEIFIREYILPLEIAKFFFFDAEKIVSLAEATSREERLALSKAYSEVLGIHKYEELRERFETLKDEYRKKEASHFERQEFNEIETSIKNSGLDIEKLEQEKEEKSEQKSIFKFESDQIQRQLISDKGALTVEEMNQLREGEKHSEEALSMQLNDLKEFYDLIPFALSGQLLSELSEQLKYEKEAKKRSYKDLNIDRKINDILVDLENLKKGTTVVFDNLEMKDFYESNFKTLIKKHFSDQENDIPNNYKPLHDFSDSEVNELDALINNLKHSFKDKFLNLVNSYNQTKAKLDGIKRKLRQAEKDADDEYTNSLREKKDDLDKKIISIDNRIEEINISIGGIQQELKTLKQRREGLRKKLVVSDKNKQNDDKISTVISNLNNFIKLFKDEKKKSLEINMKEGLNSLMHKNDFVSRVEVTISYTSGQDVEINLFTEVNGKERRLDKTSLSKGEKQLYATSLLKALVEESDIEFPIFIDSPMQKFDKEHAENIINNFYPNVSEQVVIFPLIHKELTANEYELMKGNVNKTFLINNISKHKSCFLETEVDSLITKYDELYASAN